MTAAAAALLVEQKRAVADAWAEVAAMIEVSRCTGLQAYMQAALLFPNPDRIAH